MNGLRAASNSNHDRNVTGCRTIPETRTGAAVNARITSAGEIDCMVSLPIFKPDLDQAGEKGFEEADHG